MRENRVVRGEKGACLYIVIDSKQVVDPVIDGVDVLEDLLVFALDLVQPGPFHLDALSDHP